MSRSRRRRTVRSGCRTDVCWSQRPHRSKPGRGSPLGTVVHVGAAIGQAAGQAWPPFVLVAGLLMIGAVVEADGLFAALGARIERLTTGPLALLATLLGLEAVVTAVLNLDTAVVFL